MDKAQEKTINAILQEGVDFYITVNKPGLLHKLKIKPVKREFVIYPLTLGTLLKISKIVAGIKPVKEDELKSRERSYLDIGAEAIVANKDDLINILAIAIVNRKKEPSRELVRFLADNVTPNELFELLKIVIRQMNVMDFMNSIISVKGMSLSKTGGIIAPGDSSEA